jgi:hypothetical protein
MFLQGNAFPFVLASRQKKAKKEAKNPPNGVYPNFAGVNVTIWHAEIRGAHIWMAEI